MAGIGWCDVGIGRSQRLESRWDGGGARLKKRCMGMAMGLETWAGLEGEWWMDSRGGEGCVTFPKCMQLLRHPLACFAYYAVDGLWFCHPSGSYIFGGAFMCFACNANHLFGAAVQRVSPSGTKGADPEAWRTEMAREGRDDQHPMF